MTKKKREELKSILKKEQGEKCYYCEISENKFIPLWGIFYTTRGRKLEIDRTDNSKGYVRDNCVLACALCNNAKSNKFSKDEFKKVGKVIKKVWQARKKSK